MIRIPLAAGLVVGLATLALAGCGSSEPSGTPTTPPASPQSPAVAAGDPDKPCTLLTADDINTVLDTDFGEGAAADDAARQIATCTYTSADMTSIVSVGVSQTDGAESFTTNRDLAPAYFGGAAKPIQVSGADKAYLVIAETYDAPVIGMLVDGTFAQVQAGVEGATPEQGQELASMIAARL